MSLNICDLFKPFKNFSHKIFVNDKTNKCIQKSEIHTNPGILIQMYFSIQGVLKMKNAMIWARNWDK